MACILQLETASTNCSVSVAEHGVLLGSKEHNSPSFSHSEQLHLFIEEVIAHSGISIHDLDAVAVSKGPGSYTGLRIGVSSAKGLCYALGIPLISTDTLRSLALQKKIREGVLIPMLDARRMEVYTAVYSPDLTVLEPTKALVLKKDSFLDYANKGPVYLLGSGATKCRGLLDHPNFEIDDSLLPSSKTMCKEAFEKFKGKLFEDVAYFEPYYLKDFILQSKLKT